MRDEVNRFFDQAPADRRPMLDQLHNLIIEMYPEADLVLSYQVPTYRVGKGWVALGYWKGGVSMYTNNPRYIEDVKEKHPELNTGKASVQFKLGEELPLDDIRQVVRRAIERQL